jgi:ubiquinone biosynthesis protein COQ9
MSDHLLLEKRAILHAAIENAPFDGWGQQALKRAARDAGYEEIMAARAFPEGSRDLLSFFLDETDREMIEGCEKLDLAALKIRERIAAIIRLRLEQAIGRREAVRRAISRLALPGHGPLVARHTAQTMDAIWQLAGDTSTDFNWYTKRGLLAGVYTSTLLHWLNDDSEACDNTWAFLDRRIAEVMKIQKAKFKIQKRLAKLPTPWNTLGRLRHPKAQSTP